MGRRYFLFATFAAIVMLSVPPAVLAHADLVSASPGPGDRLSGVPEELVAHFSQNLDADRSSIELRDATGEAIARGGYDASALDERTMSLALPELDPGLYEVRWTTLSTEDGELDRDTYTFTVVAPAPSPTPTESPTAPGLPSGDADQALVPIAAALLIVGVLAVWLLRRRST